MTQPSLNYSGYQILTVSYHCLPNYQIQNIDFDIEYTPIPDVQNPNKFAAQLYLKMYKGDDFVFNLTALGHFEIMPDNVQTAIKDSFYNVNAPSILYPYLRAFVANFTSLSGQNMLNLPPINFIQLYENQKKK